MTWEKREPIRNGIYSASAVFLLPENDIFVPNRGMPEVRFEIEEVYPGTLYEDTCLTGLVMEFSERHSH